MPLASTNICDSSILNLAIERSRGVAFKQVDRGTAIQGQKHLTIAYWSWPFLCFQKRLVNPRWRWQRASKIWSYPSWAKQQWRARAIHVKEIKYSPFHKHDPTFVLPVLVKPRMVLKADDPSFTPVDVAKGPLMVTINKLFSTLYVYQAFWNFRFWWLAQCPIKLGSSKMAFILVKLSTSDVQKPIAPSAFWTWIS